MKRITLFIIIFGFLTILSPLLSKKNSKPAQETSKDTLTSKEYIDEGLIYLIQKKYKEAENCFTRALEINPDSAEAYKYLGIMNQEIKNHSQARTNFIRAMRIKTNSYDLYYQLALTYEYNDRGEQFGRGFDYEKAKDAYSRAIELNQEDADSHFNLGKLKFSSGNIGDSIPLFNKAREIDFSYGEAYYFLGRAYEKLEDPERALFFYEFAVVLGKNKYWLDDSQKRIKGLSK